MDPLEMVSLVTEAESRDTRLEVTEVLLDHDVNLEWEFQHGLVAAGGAPSWTSPRAAFLKPHATLGERVSFLQDTEGWLATDEWTFAANSFNQTTSHYHVLPIALYSHLTDEFVFESDQFQITNTGVSLLPVLYGAHWIGVEIDRQHDTPEIAILQCAQANQNRIEAFVCQLMHMPAHRLVINHWANTTPPGMCGWSILWRWISLTHSQPAFARSLQDFHSLSDDRKRIILRALAKSAHAWERSAADPILQQVAHTIRQSFLTNLFAFNAGVHTRMDTLAISAAGQPSAVFPPAPTDQTQIPLFSTATQTSEAGTGHVSDREQPEMQQAHAQTDLSFAGDRQEGPNVHRAERDAIQWRLQEFCLFPAQAASDELDHVLDICRHFAGLVYLLPCCRWHPDADGIEVISDRTITLGHHLEFRGLIHCFMHWFAIHVVMNTGMVWVHVYGFPGNSNEHFPLFLRHFAQLFNIQTHQIRAQSFDYPCPTDMCGFMMFDVSTQACGIQFLPWCEDQVRFLQQHEHADQLAYIGRHAVRLWREASQDHQLVRKAFAVRTMFLTHMLQTGQTETHVRGRGVDSHTSATRDGRSGVIDTSPPSADSVMPALSSSTRQFLQQHLRTHYPVQGLCSCHTKGFTARIRLQHYIRDWHAYAMVSCQIVKPEVIPPNHVGDLDCRFPPCMHEHATTAHMILHPEVWQAFGPGKHAYVVEAKLIWSEGIPVIDLRAPQSGLSHVQSVTLHEDSPIRFGEFFAGGFSGWSFALQFLQRAHLPLQHAYSIEHDSIMARHHALNHSPHPVVTCPKQVASLVEQGLSLEDPITIVANIEHAWWHHICQPIDIMLASPPCQPWSRAGSEHGLDAHDGRLILLTLVQCSILQPAVLCMEEVSSMMSHKHFPWVKAFCKWAGYDIVWCESVNLAEVLPHSRTRLLMVATRVDDPRIARLDPIPWTKPVETPTLSSVLMPASHPCHKFAPPLDADTFAMYFQNALLPKRAGTTMHEKRRLRIKTEHDQHACIMANYAFSHELPAHTLREGGLIGSFVLFKGQVRWLSIPEIALLFGCNAKLIVSQNPKVATHLLGNAIAVPHALICILNGLAQHASIKWSQVPLWMFEDALAMRLTCDTVCIEVDDQNQTIILNRQEVSPTLSWESHDIALSCLRVRQDLGDVVIRVDEDTAVWDLLRMLFRLPSNTQACWKPRGDVDVRLPLMAADTVPGEGLVLETMWLGPLSLEEHHFSQKSGPIIVVFTLGGIFAMQRSKVETIDDMMQVIQPHGTGLTHAMNHAGRPWELADSPPNMLFVLNDLPKQVATLDPLITERWTTPPDCMICITTMFQALSILDAYCKLGLTEVIRALGWKTVLDSSIDDPNVKGTSVQLTIQSARHSAFAPLQDLQNVIMTRLFIAYLQYHIPTNSGGTEMQVKLWDSFVWSGQVPMDTKTGVFVDAWSFATKHVGRNGSLRVLLRGQRLNPEWRFDQYHDLFPSGGTRINLHMVMELQGGGSKAEAAIKTKEDFVARALQVGFDPLETRNFAQQLYQEAGAARVRSLLAIPEEEAFIQQCNLIAKQIRITVPELHDLEASRSKRAKAAVQKKVQGQNHIPVQELGVVPGTFCRHDGTEVAMCTTPSTPDHGVIFLEPEQITPFVQEHSAKYEELMVVVPGVKCPLQDKICQRFNIPARPADNSKVVITACCHSLGKQAVTVRLSDGDAAGVTETTKVMFVAWRSECSATNWESILEAPIQTIFRIMGITPAETISGPPQGRSWRAFRQSTIPTEAESFCFYARVISPMLEAVLAKSGRQGVYTTPKSEHSNLADPRYSIVWTSIPSAEEACKKADETSGSLGIVRSAKDKPTYGVRTLAKNFDAVWQAIRPTDPKPHQINGDYLYRISPVPEGATHDDVMKWITMEKLHAKPLRALNSTTWLIVGVADLQKAHFTWKQNAILVQPIESRFNQTRSTILAGGRPTQPVRRTWKSEAKHDQGIDPLTIHDPWARGTTSWSDWEWSSTSSGTGGSSSSSSKASISTASQDVQVKQQRELDKMQSKLATLESAISQQGKECTNLRKEVHVEIQQVRKEVNDRVSEVKDAFQTTLTEALTQTQTALRSSFKEDFEQLKALLAHPSRKRANQDDVDMREG